ncbi:MAG: N-formylglutamate amidohydrolase [Rhodobacterales bacterium RIFCSPHIGHO2_02_FULL_62_130]|jgi:predicted N-formylglutamate amidohydrolase|nr:MAG: N-formylglutamate amidohydrolase [Rhodobacterales bacterium RIFCSPHIGHO2_02_FULL_62_130]OHC58988.1 MAG: N-formylglutamate amidohydrolase [Rhodobacterales bacterium RIFCSPHIGHO2_12_FULL_62_75]HCZ01296.1 N-formylglutamate amidohydrolase [Rhodobacter sp.]
MLTRPISAPATLLDLDEPPPYGVINPDGASDLLLLCEHALPRIPRRLAHLGLPKSERLRHIGWDIGALALARDLSARLDAPLFHTSYSRLVVDCNRPLDNASLIPETSESTAIPGNLGLATVDRAERLDTLFHPFQSAVSRRLDLRCAAGKQTFVVGVHSYTPVYKGVARPWHAGVLYAAATEFAGHLMQALAQEDGLVIGDNEPYRIDHDDYTVPVHGDARGLPALLIEVRHELIASAEGVAEWAERLERCLRLTVDAMA